MQKAEKVLVIAGVAVAVLMLAQTAIRAGTMPIDVSTMFDHMKLNTAPKEADAMMQRFYEQSGMGWDQFLDAMKEDQQLFEDGIHNGGNDDNPGVTANLGGLSGRPYTMIDGEFYFMGGR